MATNKLLHMNGGFGETSYANNSLLQRKVILKAKPILKENITRVYRHIQPDCLNVVDLGCSSGPNTLMTASEIMGIIHAVSLSLELKAPAFQIFLNDLPGNDFNTIFQSLPEFYSKLRQDKGDNFGPGFIVGVPGSFYERLFPDSSIHFFHSSFSVHWLSQVPKGLTSNGGTALNKGDIYITDTSPPAVRRAYCEQFREDFKLFLKFRSVELVRGGGMVLTFRGRLEDENPSTTFNLVGKVLHDMVLEGKVEEAKLDNFDIPYYGPTEKEVREIIEDEGSFSVERVEFSKLGWDADMNESNEGSNNIEDGVAMKAKFVAQYIRAVTEPLLKTQFGEAITMDDLFLRFTNKLVHLMQLNDLVYNNLVVSLTKRQTNA
ncbi:probable methyltransferase TCM_000168 [Prosopis cineraria]|uniref:probable methyltransferase TCM_000168 n=1 Tax=Prosopis cineraria TaxID=364024 RepID=UPI00240F531A|nr:probable methyltransferase TCM_000168 [Prosopis cineraria]